MASHTLVLHQELNGGWREGGGAPAFDRTCSRLRPYCVLLLCEAASCKM